MKKDKVITLLFIVISSENKSKLKELKSYCLLPKDIIIKNVINIALNKNY